MSNARSISNLVRPWALRFEIGDLVRTPSGREAIVRDSAAGRLDLEYTDAPGDGVILDAGHLRLVSRGE